MENTYPLAFHQFAAFAGASCPPPDSSQKRRPYSFTKQSEYCMAMHTPSGES